METREDLGYVETDPEVNERIRRQLGLESSVEGVSIEVLKNAADVALRRFPPCQRGESVTDREFSMRLRELRGTGYPVEPYSRMNKAEKGNYLAELRSEIKDRVNSVPNYH